MKLQARETGICPIREELYSQVFDELIRQVTVNCVERGLLLLRIRDDMRSTIAAYQVLFVCRHLPAPVSQIEWTYGFRDTARICKGMTICWFC